MALGFDPRIDFAHYADGSITKVVRSQNLIPFTSARGIPRLRINSVLGSASEMIVKLNFRQKSL